MTLYVSKQIKATHDRLWMQAQEIRVGDVMPLWEDDPVTVTSTRLAIYNGVSYVELTTSDGLLQSLIPSEGCRIYRPSESRWLPYAHS